MARNLELFNSDLEFREMAGHIYQNIAYIANQQVLRDLRNHYPLLYPEFIIENEMTLEEVRSELLLDLFLFGAAEEKFT